MSKDRQLEQDTVNRLRAIQGDSDIEGAHSDADDVLCDLLNTLGYTDVVNEFHKVEKWYA